MLSLLYSLLQKRKNMLKRFLPILFILIASYVAASHLLKTDLYFPIHDDTQTARVFTMAKSLADGMIPVRWVSDLGYGYGYPIYNFYAPLAYYFGGLLVIGGLSVLTATKAMMLVGVLVSGISMYLLARQFWGVFGGMIAAVLYMYAPYHGVNIYVRGAVSEYWAYGILPLTVLGFYMLFKSLQEDEANHENSKLKIQNAKLQFKNKKVWTWIIISAISLAAVILSHNLTAMMISPFLIALLGVFSYILITKQKLYAIRYLLYAFFLGLALSAFYWIPALFEMRYTNVASQIGGGAAFGDHFVCIKQLWDSPMGYGGSTPTCTDGLSYKIGKIHILFVLLSLFSLFFLRKQREKKIVVAISLAVATIGVFMMLSPSLPLWNLSSFTAYFQYPWRFLAIVLFAITLMSGSFISLLEQIISPQHKQPILALVVFLVTGIVIATNAEFFTPRTMSKVASSEYTTSQAVQWEASKISDEYLPPYFSKPDTSQDLPKQRFVLSMGEGIIMPGSKKTQSYFATVLAKSPVTVHVNIAYFPAWKAFVDGKESVYKVVSSGMQLTLPAEDHTIAFKFVQTPLQKFSNLLSIAGLVFIVLGIITVRKRSASTV